MRIDSHQHFWRYDPVRYSWIDNSMQKIAKDFLPEELFKVLEENRMDGCVAVQAEQSEAETDFLLDIAQKKSFVKGVVGWVDLRSDQLRERLELYSKNRFFKGVRHIVQAEKEGFMLEEAFFREIRQLREFD